MGDWLIAALKELQQSCPKILEVRGRGLMIGIELSEPYKEIRNRLLLEEHCFTGCAGTSTLRLLPPLCLSMDEAKDFIARFKRVINA